MSIDLGSTHAIRKMSEAEAAYLAGFVDGEGSVIIYRSKQSLKRPYYYGFRLNVTNTDFAVLKKIQEYTGCGSVNLKRHTNDPKWKDSGLLVWQMGPGANILLQIMPYMVIKKLQADVALKFMDAKRRAKELGQDTYNEQEFCYAEMGRLNARGKSQQKYTEFKRAVRVERSCTYSGCGKKHYSRGYCKRHYKWVFQSLSFAERKSRACEECGAFLPEKSPLQTKFCSASCKMKWHRREGCYSGEAQVEARKCSVEGCERPHQAQGMCRRHFMQKWHADNQIARVSDRFSRGDAPKFCTAEGCNEPTIAHGLCGKHYRKWRLAGNKVYAAPSVN